MAVVENRFVCDLSKPVQAQALKGNVFSLDNLGSRISVLIYENGQPATISGSVTANCILPDGSTVNVNGGLTTENGGSKAYVDIPQSCILIPGILKIAIKCTSSSVITTLAAIVANVYMTKTDNVITPSQQIIADWNAEISAAIATQNAAIANQDTKINDLKSAIDAYQSNEIYLSLIPNSYVKHDGKVDTYNGWSRTDYIPVDLYESITVESPANSSYNCFYNAEKGLIKYFTVGNVSSVTLEIPSDAKYVMFSNTDAGMQATKATFVEKLEYRVELLEDTDQYQYQPVTQFLLNGNKITGKCYQRGEGTSTIDDANTSVFPAIPVQKGVTYYYKNINAYYSKIIYNDGSYSMLSDTTGSYAEGSLTPTKNGLVYISALTSLVGVSSMFSNAAVSSVEYYEGYKFNTDIQKQVNANEGYYNALHHFDADELGYVVQFLIAANKDTGKYYTRGEGTNTDTNANLSIFPAIPVKKGKAYYYKNLNAFYSKFIYNDGTYEQLSNTSGSYASGSITAAKDGFAYISALTSVIGVSSMFSNAAVSDETYYEGYKFIKEIDSSFDSIYIVDPYASNGQILYEGDTRSESGHIVNAVMYKDGVIIAARSNGKIVRIGYDGTEEVLLSLSGSNMDWRGLFMDSNENVYASPHASWGSLEMTDRGLYRLVKGGSSMTKVISLYNTESEVETETEENNDTIWTMCEDSAGNLYAGVYAHTIRANPAIYKSTDGGQTWTYLINFNTAGLTTDGMHIHSVIFSKWQKALYCIVGEINTVFKSTDGGTTWTDLQVYLAVKGSAMCATPYGILIGSDGSFNCDIDILLPDDVHHKRVFRGWANTVFAIRRSDLTGYVYAFTKIDSSVNTETYFPPVTVIEGTTTIEQWQATVTTAQYNRWLAYHDSVEDEYPDDAIRPQHYAILVSQDGGKNWQVLKRFSCASTAANGLWTTGYFHNGECLTGRMERSGASVTVKKPIIISEGKHRYVSTGCNLDGEILVRTNASAVVEVI